jgi:hypothetical protein
LLAEVVDGGDGEFHAVGKVPGFVDAVANELEHGVEARAEGPGELSFGGSDADEGFLFNQGVVRGRGWVGDQLDGAK